MFKIETERLILRNYQEADWEAVHEYAQQGDKLIYAVWAPNTEEETKAFIEQVISESKEKPRRRFDFAIILKSSMQLIGGCSFWMDVDIQKRAEFGYVINPDFWNKGFATEASKGLLKFMIEEQGISEIEAGCNSLNIASQKVLEKCGLTLVKETKNDQSMNGRDSYHYELIKGENK